MALRRTLPVEHENSERFEPKMASASAEADEPSRSKWSFFHHAESKEAAGGTVSYVACAASIQSARTAIA
jgi:hypothetical protein